MYKHSFPYLISIFHKNTQKNLRSFAYPILTLHSKYAKKINDSVLSKCEIILVNNYHSILLQIFQENWKFSSILKRDYDYANTHACIYNISKSFFICFMHVWAFKIRFLYAMEIQRFVWNLKSFVASFVWHHILSSRNI